MENEEINIQAYLTEMRKRIIEILEKEVDSSDWEFIRYPTMNHYEIKNFDQTILGKKLTELGFTNLFTHRRFVYKEILIELESLNYVSLHNDFNKSYILAKVYLQDIPDDHDIKKVHQKLQKDLDETMINTLRNYFTGYDERQEHFSFPIKKYILIHDKERTT